MNRPHLRQNFANASMYLLGALSLMLLMSSAIPYSPAGLSSPAQAITDVLNNPALRIPIFLAGLALLFAGLWLAGFIIALPKKTVGPRTAAGTQPTAGPPPPTIQG